MKTVSENFVRELIDFAPTEETKRMGFADAQLRGAVAGYNMLARNKVAYVADEVGMGKTYVALGIMGLVRYLNPKARIMVLAPRENIQLKWIKELRNFTRFNWKIEDNRVKNLHANPVRTPAACGHFDDLGRFLTASDHADLFLRNTTFSLSMKDREARVRSRMRLQPFVPWIDRSVLDAKRNEDDFRVNFGRALNAIVPEIDLLVVDESHNFKKGFGPRVSNRNRLLGITLGHPMEDGGDYEWYGPRVKALLMLSATPFEYDYRDLYNQLDVFGKANTRVSDARGEDSLHVRALVGDDEEAKREVTRRFLIRRVGYLNIGGKKYSKNLYRREWRHGGYAQHDDPMSLDNPRERLTIGLVQKKVSEVLGDRRFNNSFQIGMLSSFESFLETISKSRRLATIEPQDDGDGEEVRVFDGDQAEERVERRGIDTHSLEAVIHSYRKEFDKALPHPKLDATADHLRDAFDTGEKALVFVRRVATTAELKAKLDRHYDRWIRERFEQEVPEAMQAQVLEIFKRYAMEKRGEPVAGVEDTSTPDDVDKTELVYSDEEDEGGTDSFFSWFFRGDGPKGLLSGAAFQKNRLRSTSSAYATMFEDNRVAWLLEYPTDAVEALRSEAGAGLELESELREEAWGYFRQRSKQAKGYPRLYVFEGYQVAALRRLVAAGGERGERAQTILGERYLDLAPDRGKPPAGFPDAGEILGTRTLFTELVNRPSLRERIWPEETREDFRRTFRRREQRREMISAMARLGAAYVDLYLIAVGLLGSFDLHVEGQDESPVDLLIDRFLDLLEKQVDLPGMHAFRELAMASETFDVLLATNFPEVRDLALHELATLYGRTLQHQSPVGRMAGGVNKRMIRQFRMPGYPLVLVTTDVLQEGEDLHTFCKNVIHYGITWTPSAMEQRTGRIDRIHSLAQRRLDGRDRPPDPHEFIQVHYPHLSDTVERLQVVRVMERLNSFLKMVHQPTAQERTHDSRIDVNRAALKNIVPPEPLRESLQSAFPVQDGWMEGEVSESSIEALDLEKLEQRFGELCSEVVDRLKALPKTGNRARHFEGKVAIRRGKVIDSNRIGTVGVREQPFELHMRSQVLGDATLIRCVSPVGELDLSDPDIIDELYQLQRGQGISRVCAHPGDWKRSMVTIERDRLFRMDTTQPEEIIELVESVALQADHLESELLDVDRDWDESWQHVEGEEANDG